MDMVANALDVKAIQESLLHLANDRNMEKLTRTLLLKTPLKEKHWFRMNVYKQTDEFDLTDKLILTFNDIHEEVLANERLLFQANRDSLTGLYNRNGFLQEAEKQIALHEAGYFVMSCIDIEKFKVINDQYGVEKGDDILRRMGTVLSELSVNENFLCGHIAGDKFAVLYPVKLVASPQILAAQKAAQNLDTSLPNLRFYIGRCVVDDKSLSISAIFDRALIAKETIKGRYDVQFATYDESMRTAILRKQKITGCMKKALQEGQFEVWLQPQYNHASGLLSGAEALVRWRHPQDGLIQPNDFIPVFEENGFIYELDKFVWEKTCSLLREWLDSGLNPVPVSVNISRYDVFRHDLTDVIIGLVEKYNLPFSLLRLEITESAFVKSAEQIIAVVKELIGYGFTMEIDDFGSGYSSLNTLKDVPAQILKMDMRFFDTSGDTDRGGNIIESVVRMSRWLGMSVIAEGVEKLEQANYLKSIGCNNIQGYLYAKPIPAPEYTALLNSSETEGKLPCLQTLESWDNAAFWNPQSMESLIFNSYIGGACIFEYYLGHTELLRINDGYRQSIGKLGVQDDSILGNSIVKYLNEHNRAVMKLTIKQAITNQKEETCELELSDGKVVEHVQITVRVIAKASDRYLCYGVVQNLTKQREMERRDLENAQLLQVVMSNINGGVSAVQIEADGTSRFVFCNDKYFELYGYTKEQAEAEHLDVLSRILPEDLPMVLNKVLQLKYDKKSTRIDYRIVKRDGSLAFLRSNSSLMSNQSFGKDIITSVITDITEQRELNDKFKAVVDNINGGVSAVYLHNDKPEYVIVNDRYFEIIGYTREQFNEEVKSVFDLIHPEDRERVKAQFTAAGMRHGSYSMTYRCIRRDGSICYVLCNTNVIRLFGVAEPVQLAVSNDITPEMEAQKQLEFLNESAHAILAQPDTELAINDTLQKILEYFGADRSYVIELHSNEMLTTNTYEVCAAGVLPQINNLQAVPYTQQDFWYRMLINNDFFVLEDVDALPNSQNDLRQLLQGQNIKSLIFTPLLRDGVLIGFAGIDNPSKAVQEIQSLKALSDYIAILLTRRDLSQKIATEEKRIAERQKELLDHLLQGAALFEYDGTNLKVIHINKRYWELVEREPVEYKDKSALSVVHPDDRPAAHEEILAAIREKRYMDMVLRIRCEVDKYKSFHVKANIVPKAKGKYLLYLTFTPLSEQKISLHKVITTALTAIMRTTTDMAFVKDKELRYVCASPSAVAIAKCKDESELVGKTDVELFGAVIGDKYQQDDNKVLATGKSLINMHDFIPCEMGMPHDILTSKYPIFDADNNVIGVYGVSRDVTQLQLNEAQLQLLSDSMPGGIGSFEFGPHGLTALLLNDGFYRSSGYTREDYAALTKDDALALVYEEDRQKIYAMVEEHVKNKDYDKILYCDIRCRLKNDTYRWYSLKGRLAKTADDKLFINAVLFDIDEWVKQFSQLKAKQQELEAVVSSTPGGIFKYAADGDDEFVFISDTMYSMLGYTPEEFREKFHNRFSEMVWHEDRAATLAKIDEDIAKTGSNDSCIYSIETKSGQLKWVFDAGYLYTDENGKRWFVVVIVDIDERKKVEDQVVERAEKDLLTNIYNRETFIIKMEEQLRAAKPDELHALFILDIDNFKQINDRFGHAAGDLILQELSGGIKTLLRHDDLVGRMGGDEFFVFLKHVNNKKNVLKIAKKIAELKIELDGFGERVTTSAGIVLFAKEDYVFEKIYKKADEALYRQKAGGKNGFTFAD